MKSLFVTTLLIIICVQTGCVPQPVISTSDPRGRAQTDLAAFAVQLQLFKSLMGRLPTTEEGLSALVERPKEAGASWRQLLEKVPLDPWQHPYRYRRSPDRSDGFDIFSLGADGIESADDIHLQGN